MAIERDMEGLWLAIPEAPQAATWSVCLVAARAGGIVGADLNYHFGGTYRFEGDRLIVAITSDHYAGATQSLWGGHEGVELVLSGNFNTKEMIIGGHFAGDQRSGETRVTLRKLRDWSK